MREREEDSHLEICKRLKVLLILGYENPLIMQRSVRTCCDHEGTVKNIICEFRTEKNQNALTHEGIMTLKNWNFTHTHKKKICYAVIKVYITHLLSIRLLLNINTDLSVDCFQLLLRSIVSDNSWKNTIKVTLKPSTPLFFLWHYQ